MSKFSPVPNGPISQLLTAHDDPKHRGFITHLDRSPLSHKRRAFAKGLALNIALLAIILLAVSATITADAYGPKPPPLLSALRLAQDLIIAWAVYSILVSTTAPFFLRECPLRLRRGFRPAEVVFRRAPALPARLSPEDRVERYRQLAARAADPHRAHSGVWAFVTCELCAPEHRVAVDAHARIDRGEIDEAAFEAAVWLQEDGAWSVCELIKMDSMV